MPTRSLSPNRLVQLALPVAALGLLACKPPGPVTPVATNHPTINLFGFEESALHHIHNTVELHRNIFLVSYDPSKPHELEWVNCPISANYEYRKANGRRVENMHISSFADLQARVPVNYARFEAYVKGGKAIDFNYVTIGSYELIGDFTIPKDDPDCAKATHYVVTLSVGAFNFAEQAMVEGGISGEAAGTGVGAGVTAGGSKGSGTQMGDLGACMDDGTAFTDCFTPLQMMMMPLASRHWNDAAATASTTTGTTTGTTSSGTTQPPPEATAGLGLWVDENMWRPGSFMAHSLEQALVVASRINETTEFGFDDKASTVVAGYVTPAKPQTLSRPLEAGKTYAVFANGATTDANLDIVVTGPDGSMLAVDDAYDNNPAVTFVAPAEGNYEIQLRLSGGAEEFGSMVVMAEGGLQIDPDILQVAFQTLLDNATNASMKVVEMGFPNGLIFHENDWALSGTILYPGEAIRQRGIELGANSAVFSAVAHDPGMNIDLEVINVNSGAVVSDYEPDANPLVIVDQPDVNSAYDLRVIYGEGDQATLATALILTLSD